MSLLYTPPEGYFDEPFIFVFSASSLSNGQNALNQFINMDPGVGDFIMRRIAGIQSVVDPADGQIQVRDDLLRYLESVPLSSNNTDEIAFPEGVFYRQTGSIRFDLYDILIAT